MKNYLSLKGFSLAIVVSILMSSCSSDKVVSNGPFQKRKYRKGFYVDLASKTKRDKASKDLSTKNEIEFEDLAKVSIANEIEVKTSGISPKTEIQSAEITTPSFTLGVVKNNSSHKESIVEAVKKISDTNSPKNLKEATLDPELRKGIIVVLIGLIIAIFSVIPTIGWIFGLVGGVIALIGLVLILLWLLDNL